MHKNLAHSQRRLLAPILALLALCYSMSLYANSDSVTEKTSDKNCFLNLAASASPDTTVQEIADKCAQKLADNLLPKRLLKEKITQNNEFVITPHKQNYLLPFTHNSKPNQAPFQAQNVYPNLEDPIQHKEAKLQISFKVPLNTEDIFTKNDGVYFGFTMKSFWQVYNHRISSPFRETNYQPEVFYQAPIRSKALGGTWFARAGFEHESNGQTQLFSRSWNRLYLGIGFQKDNWALYFQPWYRLPEDEKVDDGDPLTPPSPKGDDNPDIHKFLGHYSLLSVIDFDKYEVTNHLRHNFESGKGSLETSVSFPLWGRLKGYLQFYQGYGESLIDYDHHVQRIGLGLLLTDLL